MDRLGTCRDIYLLTDSLIDLAATRHGGLKATPYTNLLVNFIWVSLSGLAVTADFLHNQMRATALGRDSRLICRYMIVQSGPGYAVELVFGPVRISRLCEFRK